LTPEKLFTPVWRLFRPFIPPHVRQERNAGKQGIIRKIPMLKSAVQIMRLRRTL
jgi:hypothetical protein